MATPPVSPFYAHLSRLRFIKRWGLMRNATEEDVAQHSWEVAVLAHALAHFERVIFKVGAENVISRKAMEHIGGRLTDRSFERETCGVVGVHVIYEITRESFAAGPLKNKG